MRCLWTIHVTNQSGLLNGVGALRTVAREHGARILVASSIRVLGSAGNRCIGVPDLNRPTAIWQRRPRGVVEGNLDLRESYMQRRSRLLGGIMSAAEHTLSAEVIGDLRAATRGLVLTAADSPYDEARRVYNAMIDRRPAAILRAEDVADVIAGVRFAREHSLSLAVRGGGHSVPGFGTCDDGLVIDLAAMRNVRVDPKSKRARIGGGAELGALDHAGSAFGLATPAGFISTTGVGGLTLGGGIGAYISRRFGLTCDNLVSARVVTANGQFVRAAADENEELFWALRGGGGNFGVVTEFEFQLHPVSQVFGGPILYEASAAREVAAFYRDFMRTAPRELGAFLGFQLAPPLPFIPDKRHLDPVCLIVVCWSGAADAAEQALAPLRSAGPKIAEHVGPMPYPALQSAFDALLPRGLQHYWKADFVSELSDEAIAVHAERGPTVPCVNSAVHIYPIDGAVHDVEAEATAFAHRDAKYALNIAGIWPDPKDNNTNIKWVRDYYAAAHPHSGYEGGYTNFTSEDDERRVRANYGKSFDRLAEVKRRWDPDNLFRLNQNVEPAGA